MPGLIPNPDNCCHPCEEPQSVAVPGPQGDPGTNGTNGTNGVNAFTTASLFVMPAELANVVVTVADSTWMTAGQIVFAAAGGAQGYFEVISKPTSTTVTLKNLKDTGSGAYPDNSSPGTNFPNATQVSPAGIQGASGSIPGGALLASNNLSDVASAATSRANLGLTSAATTALGTANGNIPTVNDASGLTNGEVVFATATGLESRTAANARTGLGLGTMAQQNASAVNITGGVLNGTLGAGTPASIVGTTLVASGVASFAGNVVVSSKLFSPTVGGTQSLLAATAINPVGFKVKVEGNGGAVVLVATPTISTPAIDGQFLLLQGGDNTNTVTLQDDGTLAGTQLSLGAGTRVLGKGDTLLLTWDSTDSLWYEVAFTNNT